MKKFVGTVLALCMLLACASAWAEVISTTPITREEFWGYRVGAIAVEYDKDIAAQEFDTDTFVATDILDTDNVETQWITGTRENARIYTNSEPAVLEEGSAEGRYVIIEFINDWNATQRVGLLPIRGYFTKADGSIGKARVTKPNTGTIEQLKEITAKDGTAFEPTGVLSMTNDYLHPAVISEFQLVQIEREGHPERPYNTYIRLPEGYDGVKKYPVVFTITGGAQLEMINDEVNNTDIVLFNDHHLLVWAETEKYGYEDVIAVSLRHLNTSDSIEGVDPYEDTAAAAKWIIEHYAVDTDRLYWSGQSQGSVTCWNVISRHPELCSGYFATNGGVSPSYDYDPQNLTQEMKDGTWNVLKVFVENRIPICITFGEQDSNSANHFAADYYYWTISDAYRAAGLSENEIAKLLKVRVMPSSAFTYAPGLIDHNVVRLMNWFPYNISDMMNIMLNW